MSLPRLILAPVMYMALAAAAVSEVYCTLAKFQGTMAIGLGRQENIAVASAMTPLRIETPNAQINVPARRIPFEDPETAWKVFSKSADYNTVRLPFSVKLDKIDVVSAPPPQNLLALSGAGPASLVEIHDGGEARIGGANYTVASIGLWSGLMRDPQGMPMAAITLIGDGANQPARTTLFLASDVWQAAPGGAAVYFAWRPGDPEAARAAAATALPGLESARWGIIDRGAVNWFQTFTPGTGAYLSSGENITLVAFDEKRPAVAIEIELGGKKRVVWMAANETVDGVPVRFEYPTLAPRVFMVYAWEDGRALVAAYENGQPAGQKELLPRQCFYPGPAPLNLRLDDVLSSAVPVPESESKLWAAVLESEAGQEIALRQGEAKRLGDFLVEYKRLFPPRDVNYVLTIAGTTTRQAALKPGHSVRAGHWRLRQARNECDPQTVAVLAAEYMPGRDLAIRLAAASLAALLLRIADRAMRSKRRSGVFDGVKGGSP